MYYPIYARRSDPFGMMRSILRDVNQFIPTHSDQSVFPAVNVWQGEEVVAVTAELPGIDPADIDIAVKDNVLMISGERKTPDVPEAARWHHNERRFGKFTRAIRLPFAASNDKIEARMTDGVLRIAVGRPEEDKPRRIEIKAA